MQCPHAGPDFLTADPHCATRRIVLDLYSLAEVVGVLFGVLGVALTVRQNVWCWPAGLVNVGLFIVVFAHARLYGSAALQVVYVALSIYGWRQWLRGGVGRRRLVVSRTPWQWLLGLGIAVAVSSAAVGYALSSRTDAALPYLDAALTSLSLAAQWMTTRKWIENWLVWMGVDIVYVGLYASQRLHPTSVLYLVFLVLAGLGWREWRRSMHPAVAAGGAS